MSKLYIIGNGFDLAHGLETQYKHFRRFLLKNEEQFLCDLERLYGYYPFDPDDYHIPADKQADMIKRYDAMIEDQLWNTYEDSLGKPNEEEIQGICETAADSLKDIEFGGIEDTLNAHYEEQFRFVEKLQDYVFTWAKQIDLSTASIRKKALRNNAQDWFLTFNYTPVLETVYGINSSRICHIHGVILPYDLYNRPVIGHGNREAKEWHEKWQKECADLFDEAGSSMNRAFVKFYQRTYKDVDHAMTHHAAFFKGLAGINEVLVIGHSVNQIDIPYYKKIIKENPAAVWKVYYYKDSEKPNMEQTLKNLGIKNYTMIPNKEFWDY